MKKALIAITILFASVAHAGEITPAQAVDLFKQNEATYMTVREGMTAEYLDTTVIHSEKCLRNRKEIVVKTQQDGSYLVYVSTKYLNNCDTIRREGKEFIKLEKRKIKEIPKFSYVNSVLRSLNLEKNIVSTEVDVMTFEDGSFLKEYSSIDFTQSQFYSETESKTAMDNGSVGSKLIQRGSTNVITGDI